MITAICTLLHGFFGPLSGKNEVQKLMNPLWLKGLVKFSGVAALHGFFGLPKKTENCIPCAATDVKCIYLSGVRKTTENSSIKDIALPI